MNYADRRKKFLTLIKDGMALIPSGSNKKRSNDTEYPFRQDSNFHYLTGFHEDGALLVLCSNHPKFKSVLFVTPKDPKMEMWTGIRTGVDEAKKNFSYDEVYSINDLKEKLPELLSNHKKVFLDIYNQPELFSTVSGICHTLSLRKRKKGTISPETFVNLIPRIGRMRLIKDSTEIELIKKAASITSKAHQAAMAFASPGKYEWEVQTLIEYIFRKLGGQAPAFGSIVASGNNANTLHYVSNDKQLKNNELLLIDAAAEYKCYASDVTRTFPVNGKFTGPQKDTYQAVLNAMNAAINAVKPGLTIPQIHQTAASTITQGLIDLKILNGSLDENLEKENYKKYFTHGTSHWMGIDVHDNTPYLTDGGDLITFSPGMIFTVEPGLYLPDSDQDLPQEFRGIGIRIEDDILVTKNGFENLTVDIPKEISAVEQACQKDYHQFLD